MEHLNHLTNALELLRLLKPALNNCSIRVDMAIYDDVPNEFEVFTTSGLFVKQAAEAVRQPITERKAPYSGGELTYYEVKLGDWTLQTLNNPETARW